MSRDVMIASVWSAIDEACETWEAGGAASPSSEDFVRAAETVTGREADEATRDAFYDYQCEGHENAALAVWLVDHLTNEELGQ